MVIAILPKEGGGRHAAVCMVLAVWNCHKKPRLATSAIPMDHCVAARVVAMVSDDDKKWRCSGWSMAWVVRPNSIVAVLAVENWENAIEACRVTLTSESCDLWRNTDGVADWWVHLEETDEVAKKSDAKKNAKPPNRHHLGLFVHRQGRRRAANAKAQAKAKAAAKKSEKVPESKPPKAKKVKKTILKKFKEPQEIPETVANYTRTHKGDQLVQQVMNKARRLDSIKFPGEELFSVSNGFCKLKFKNCEGVHWDKFQQAAHGYFKCSSLGLGFCFIRFSQ